MPSVQTSEQAINTVHRVAELQKALPKPDIDVIEDEGIPRAFLMQRWITIRASSPVITVVQQESDWLDLSTYADAAFWVEVANVSPAGGGTISLEIESSPTLDAINFGPVAPPLLLSRASNGTDVVPQIVRCVRTRSTKPLARYTRWRLRSSTSGTWEATIRIRGTAGFSSFFQPTLIRGCNLWLRADLGVTLSGTNVTTWADQSTFARDVSASSNYPTFNTNVINGQPTIHFDAASQNALSFGLGNGWPAFVVEQQAHVFVVNKRATATESDPLKSGFWSVETTGGAEGVKIPSNVNQHIFDDFYSANLHDCGLQQYALDKPHVYEVLSNGAFWGNWLNGISQFSTNSGTFSSPSAFSNAIGCTIDTPSTRFYPGDWAEVVLYDHALTRAERDLLIAYFNGRYGLGAV